MSYTNNTPLAFQNAEVTCGPKVGTTETCNCPGTTQNNHEQLLLYVGPVAAEAPAPPPADAPAPPPAPAPASVRIVSPSDGAIYTPATTIEIKADATGVANIQTMVLRWKINQTTYEYACPSTRCTASAGIYSWRLTPGGGDRVFYTHATTTAGQTFDSPSVRIGSTSAP